MTRKIALIVSAIILLAPSANAQSLILLNKKPRPQAATSFGATLGPVADTCNSSDAWGLCELDDFVKRCDKAGGGLSTEPGGGVDCDTSSWDN